MPTVPSPSKSGGQGVAQPGVTQGRRGVDMLKIAEAVLEISAKIDTLKAARTNRTWKPVDGRGLRNRSQIKETMA